MKKLKNLILIPLLTLCVIVAACGQIKTGKTASPNDGAPADSVLVAQSAFSPLNNKDVSGAAELYRVTSNNTLTVRLVGISVPSETGLKMVVTENGSLVYSEQLKSTSGTENYPTSLAGTKRVDGVFIRSSSNVDYGKAAFNIPLPSDDY